MLSISTTHKEQLLDLDGVIQIHGERFSPLYTEGDAANFVYIVESGLVKIMVASLDRTEIVLRVVPPGGLFGELSVLHGNLRTANAIALTRYNVTAIPAEGFRDYRDRNPEFSAYLTRLMAKQQQDLYTRIQLLALHDVQYRLVSSLIQLSEMCGPEGTEHSMYSIPLSQEDIATMIGATRETTSNKLNILARQKLVLLGRRRVAIPSLDNLRAALNRTEPTEPE